MLLPWILLLLILFFAFGAFIWSVIQRVQQAHDHYDDWRSSQPH